MDLSPGGLTSPLNDLALRTFTEFILERCPAVCLDTTLDLPLTYIQLNVTRTIELILPSRIESIEECAVREVWEETGLEVTALSPFAMYTGARHTVTNPYVPEP